MFVEEDFASGVALDGYQEEVIDEAWSCGQEVLLLEASGGED